MSLRSCRATPGSSEVSPKLLLSPAHSVRCPRLLSSGRSHGTVVGSICFGFVYIVWHCCARPGHRPKHLCACPGSWWSGELCDPSLILRAPEFDRLLPSILQLLSALLAHPGFSAFSSLLSASEWCWLQSGSPVSLYGCTGTGATVSSLTVWATGEFIRGMQVRHSADKKQPQPLLCLAQGKRNQ